MQNLFVLKVTWKRTLSVWGPLPPKVCLGVAKQFCRFLIWSHAECKVLYSSSVYGLQHQRQSILIDWRPWSTCLHGGNTEHRGLKARVLPWCHLSHVSLRKGAGEHVLHCDGSLKGLAIPRAWAKMLSCKLQSTAAASVWTVRRSHHPSLVSLRTAMKRMGALFIEDKLVLCL